MPSEFNGRSDYGPFIENGIPAGGLDSGAEGLKTPEEAKIYGREAGSAGGPFLIRIAVPALAGASPRPTGRGDAAISRCRRAPEIRRAPHRPPA